LRVSLTESLGRKIAHGSAAQTRCAAACNLLT
jgi:hypothetical protein